MAFSYLLRRASAFVLPLAIRSVGSQRTFHSAISAVLSVEKRNLRYEARRHVFLPFFRFSTSTGPKPSTDENLIRVLESEIDCAEQPNDVEDIPNGFSFEIQDNPGARTILLKKNYQDETIKIEVDEPSIPDEDVQEDDDDDQDKNVEDTDNPASLPLIVSITKGKGQIVEFGITAYPDEITIDTLSIKDSESSEDKLAYGPDFCDLPENLQKDFHEYLDSIGIKPSMMNFLFEYMRNKDKKEYLIWLKNLKSFMER
ncbi:uncharacterized protein At2g39795, mitochondrial [Manihot esculenta]|uniref:Mitochondrial glycoprotein n=1 Tax=Manihot esculenta TaxID=3983 RepID=A0A2C9V9C0_MANES|nr:uncharacterized protein At2g39795, mitochondrial [Manihot esculenta]OAY41366.1 hypothetical protein MANES_09G096100v8 [Manihot esculenta]